jgi:ferrochelatase
MTKKGILLVNLGSPDSPEIKDVKKYLDEFLMDERVIDVPYLLRAFIVKGIVLNFRPKKSAHAYSKVWTDEGSPLIVYSQRVQEQLQNRLTVPVALGMRYGNPSIEKAIDELMSVEGMEEIYLIPLYPHYAMSSYETVVIKTQEILEKKYPKVKLQIKEVFYQQDLYIEALAESMKSIILNQEYDHILFSYHGLPVRHLKKSDTTGSHCYKTADCCHVGSEAHKTCYKHQVIKTTELIADYFNIPAAKYSFSFQSRLGSDKWIEPYTEPEVERMAKTGVKKLIVICPAFVSDCLETIEEIGMGVKEMFIENGGEEFGLIECMNDKDIWIDVLEQWSNDFIQKDPLKVLEA